MTQKQIFSNYHPPTYEACNIILLNMKNHYRRLYTVKPAVDTSPPESYKLLSRKNSRSLSCLDLSLSDIPSYKFYQGSEGMKNETNRSHESQRNVRPIIKRHSCINGDKNLTHHSRSKSRMKSAVSSEQKDSSSILINTDSTKDFPLKEKLLYNAGKTGSESSQDSAYNEGEVGSSERGSRTPTPETIINNPSKSSPNVPLSSATYRRKVNNYLYLKFLTDITDEILKKGVVTNKALKRIFQDHLEANYHHLNQNRMLLELETLREKLEMPENDSLNSADFGLGSGNGSPKCLPLFREEDENDEKFSSIKSKSVFKKGLMVSKNSLGPDMLEAFTTLSDNKKLIDTIQASVKNTTTNLHQVSMLSSCFASRTDVSLQNRSLDFEYDPPEKTGESEIFFEDNVSDNSFLKKYSQASDCAGSHQQRRLSSKFSDDFQKVSEGRILDANTLDSPQKGFPVNSQSYSTADQGKRPISNFSHDSPRKVCENSEFLSEEHDFKSQKLTAKNGQSSRIIDMNQQRRPSKEEESSNSHQKMSAMNSLSSSSTSMNQQRRPSVEKECSNSQQKMSAINSPSPSSTGLNQQRRPSVEEESSSSQQKMSATNSLSSSNNGMNQQRRPSEEEKSVNSQQKMSAINNGSSSSTDMNLQRRPSVEKESSNSQQKMSAINSWSSNNADLSQQSKVLSDAKYDSPREVSKNEGTLSEEIDVSVVNCQVPSSAGISEQSRVSAGVRSDASSINSPDNAQELPLINSQLPDDLAIDSPRRPSPDLRCDTPCESIDDKLSSLAENTISNTCSNDLKSLIGIASDQCSLPFKDHPGRRPTEIQNLAVDSEKGSMSSENCRIVSQSNSPDPQIDVNEARSARSVSLSLCSVRDVSADESSHDHSF